jgi:acyl-coenzyme A thioesterase PaaI-like protein
MPDGVSVDLAMSRPEPPSYPPEFHIVRDLAPLVLRSEQGSAIHLPIVPEILDDAGRVRVGTVATAIDIIAGETAIREVLPNWVATANLSVQVGELPGSGTLRARPRVIRKGRTTLVIEVDLDHLESAASCGLSTIAFSILPSRTGDQPRVHWVEEPAPRSQFANESSGFKKSLPDTLGLEFDSGDPAIARLAVGPYVINTLGAMQGGVVAILIDAAADHFGASVLGEAARVRSLEIHYLNLARVGPVRAEARALFETGSGLMVRVELHDEGREDVLLTVATLLVERTNA